MTPQSGHHLLGVTAAVVAGDNVLRGNDLSGSGNRGGYEASHRSRGAHAGGTARCGPGSDAGHVRYVTPSDGGERAAELLAAIASDPLALALLGGGGVGTVAAGAGWLRLRPFRADFVVLRTTLRSYDDLLPWLARLAIGLPMAGAGFTGYLFSPAATAGLLGVPGPLIRLYGIGVGFLLVFGFATRIAALAGFVGYVAGLAFSPPLVLALEYPRAFSRSCSSGVAAPAPTTCSRGSPPPRGRCPCGSTPFGRRSRRSASAWRPGGRSSR
ncbi:MAG: DoxX family protein [Halolamina sp.]